MAKHYGLACTRPWDNAKIRYEPHCPPKKRFSTTTNVIVQIPSDCDLLLRVIVKRDSQAI